MNREVPPVVKAMHDLILAWVRQVEQVPRLHRYTLGSRVTECLLNAQQSILSGRVSENRLKAIQVAQADLEMAKYTLRVLVDIKALSVKKLAHLAGLLVPVEKQLAGREKQVLRVESQGA
jgi:hypothetical protein